MASLFLTKEQIFLTRKSKENRLEEFLSPHERLLIDFKSLACWERPLSSLVVVVVVVAFLVLVPNFGFFFFLSSSLLLGKSLNLARHSGLWGARPFPSSATEEAAPSTSSAHRPIDLDVPRLARSLASIWLHAEYGYERLLRLRWESRGRFCAASASTCLAGYFVGDAILPMPVLTLGVFLCLTLPALAHHRLHHRLLRRFAPLLMQFDLAVDIKRRPFGSGGAAGERRMRGVRPFDSDSRLHDIDEVDDDDVALPDIDDDVGQGTDDDTDVFDADSFAFNSSSLRDEGRHRLVDSHLVLDAAATALASRGAGDRHSASRCAEDRHLASRGAGDRRSAPPSLFTTEKDLQDLGLMPFDERDEETAGGVIGEKMEDSADEATGLTPDWSREASGDEEDDSSLMEFLPEGVSRMPSITPSRSSRSWIGGESIDRSVERPIDHRVDRRVARPSVDPVESSDRFNARLLAAGADLIASSGARLQQTLSNFSDNPGSSTAARNQQNYAFTSSDSLRSQIADALLDETNGNSRRRTPASSSSSEENSGFEIIDAPGQDDRALLEAAMREEGL